MKTIKASISYGKGRIQYLIDSKMGQQMCVIFLIFCGFFVFSLVEGIKRYKSIKKSKHQEFDWELFKAINHNSKEPNLIVSTFSVKLILSTIAAAGNEKVRGQIFNKLFPQVPEGFQDRDYYQNILNSLKKESDQFKLYLGNKIYLDQKLSPNPNFFNIVRNIFASETEKVDFSNKEETVSIINEWTANKTNGNIKDILKTDDLQDVISVLVNTIYFKGIWENIFSKERTSVKEFHVNSEKTVNASMMRQVDSFNYFYSTNLGAGGATALRLGYRGGKYAMTIILPNEMDGLNDVINSIDENKIKHFQNEFEVSRGEFDLSLPKFKFESTTHLKNILKSIGITDIFNENSPLPGLGKGITVSDVFQKAGIKVDEEGTEIYVATELTAVTVSLPHYLVVDHPFMFFVEDEQTGVVLFAGKVTDPTV